MASFLCFLYRTSQSFIGIPLWFSILCYFPWSISAFRMLQSYFANLHIQIPDIAFIKSSVSFCICALCITSHSSNNALECHLTYFVHFIYPTGALVICIILWQFATLKEFLANKGTTICCWNYFGAGHVYLSIDAQYVYVNVLSFSWGRGWRRG